MNDEDLGSSDDNLSEIDSDAGSHAGSPAETAGPDQDETVGRPNDDLPLGQPDSSVIGQEPVVEDSMVEDTVVDEAAIEQTGIAHMSGDPSSDSSNDMADAVDPVFAASDLDTESLVLSLETVTAERDKYLEMSQRTRAELENYRSQVVKREAEARERANESLVSDMLPVLDAYDAALDNGVSELAPLRLVLVEALTKHGLERIDPKGEVFDPNAHEAVMHEAGGDGTQTVGEVLRAGYMWRGRVLRPAMVKVIG